MLKDSECTGYIYTIFGLTLTDEVNEINVTVVTCVFKRLVACQSPYFIWTYWAIALVCSRVD